jgi:hypothetical protein
MNTKNIHSDERKQGNDFLFPGSCVFSLTISVFCLCLFFSFACQISTQKSGKETRVAKTETVSDLLHLRRSLHTIGEFLSAANIHPHRRRIAGLPKRRFRARLKKAFRGASRVKFGDLVPTFRRRRALTLSAQSGEIRAPTRFIRAWFSAYINLKPNLRLLVNDFWAERLETFAPAPIAERLTALFARAATLLSRRPPVILINNTATTVRKCSFRPLLI